MSEDSGNGFHRWTASSKRERRPVFASGSDEGKTPVSYIDKATHFLSRAGLIIIAISAVFIILSFISPPNEDPVRRDALMVMNVGMLPYVIAGYCHKEVSADPALFEAVEQWNRRNAVHLDRVAEAVKATGDMTTRRKNEIQRKVLKDAKRTVESHQDRKAYCADHARALQDGMFDLDKNPTIVEAMRGLAAVDLTRRRTRDASGQWKYVE